MKSDSGTLMSPWADKFPMPAFPPLDRDVQTEVCIVGAGIAGVSVAYHLVRSGIPVVLIDDGTIGGGETGRTTAHLASALDDRYRVLERIHGEKGARLAAQSHAAAVDQLEENALREHIDCDFRRMDGFLFEPPDGDPENIVREYEACRRAGLEVETVDQAPLPFVTGRALRFARQAQFHPLKYLRGLVMAVHAGGGVVHCHTRASHFSKGKGGHIRTADGFTISANRFVIATNTPVNDWVVIHTKQAAYRTYVLGFDVPLGRVPTALFWDDQDPYHYVRLQQDPDRTRHGRDLLLVGGEDHKVGQLDDMAAPFRNLEQWTRERFPEVGAIEFRWSGQIMEPNDGLAFIGKNPLQDSTYIATGDSGNGMTHGAIAGLLIRDLIMGRENEWETLYDPRRRSWGGVGDFVAENVNVAAQYEEWISAGDVEDAGEIAPGSGAVMRSGGSKVAVYRDVEGQLHCMSAVCPHLGCIVRWNANERTWDCPCHGSRFDAHGDVVNGPANRGLERMPEADARACVGAGSGAGSTLRSDTPS